MHIRKIKAGSGARCWGGMNCPSANPDKRQWDQRQIKYGKKAIDLGQQGFVCMDCAPRYINERFADLISISKDLISDGHGEMTDTIIFNLGEVEKIIGEKNE